jgi:pyridoxine/pyridoxamine 5'-phosphate oxidase
MEINGMVKAGRPRLPKAYGIKPVTQGRLMEWPAVVTRLTDARNYWVATSSPDGLPHAVPVWGIWHEGAFYFGTDPKSRKAVNLAANNAVVVHLESGDDVVILEGRAIEVAEGPIADQLDEMYSRSMVTRSGNPPYVDRQAFAWAEAISTAPMRKFATKR